MQNVLLHLHTPSHLAALANVQPGASYVLVQRYAKSVERQDDAGIDIAGQDSKSKATPLTALL